MQTEIRLPELGTRPVVLSVWFADSGEPVYEGDRLVEVLVAGATFDVPAPGTGRLVEKCALPDDLLEPGQVLGIVEVDASAASSDSERRRLG
jgi:pyruvate/2-oxoglutarate dehydrogenase complex dihydrolipoamide acyltransferase (E2) component